MDLTNLPSKIIDIVKTKSLSIEQRLTQLCELLQSRVDYYDWVGFYFADQKEKNFI